MPQTMYCRQPLFVENITFKYRTWREYLQWKQTMGTGVTVAIVCGYVIRSHDQNANEYTDVVAQSLIKYISCLR